MIRRSTWILLGVLVLVVGAYIFLRNKPLKLAQATPSATPNAFLITSADGNLISIQIVDAEGNKVRMQRDPSQTWVLTAPRNGSADQSQAGAAQSQVGAIKIMAVLATPPAASATGLDQPAYTVDLSFATGREHQIQVGNLTPTSSGYYVRLDGGKQYVVSQNSIEGLLNLLKNPPYPATPTPEVTITPSAETATPTP